MRENTRSGRQSSFRQLVVGKFESEVHNLSGLQSLSDGDLGMIIFTVRIRQEIPPEIPINNFRKTDVDKLWGSANLPDCVSDDRNAEMEVA